MSSTIFFTHEILSYVLDTDMVDHLWKHLENADAAKADLESELRLHKARSQAFIERDPLDFNLVQFVGIAMKIKTTKQALERINEFGDGLVEDYERESKLKDRMIVSITEIVFFKLVK